MYCPFRLEHLDRLARDRPLLVSGDHPDANATRRRGNAVRSLLIRSRIKHEAEPATSLADTPADLRCVLADAGGEDQAIKPAESCGQGADLAGDTVNEQVHRFLGARVIRSEQLAHVAAEA